MQFGEYQNFYYNLSKKETVQVNSSSILNLAGSMHNLTLKITQAETHFLNIIR